jgi:hypothetical protein
MLGISGSKRKAGTCEEDDIPFFELAQEKKEFVRRRIDRHRGACLKSLDARNPSVMVLMQAMSAVSL